MKSAIDTLIIEGQTLGALDAQKRAFADDQEYAQAKEKKVEMDQSRERLYRELSIAELLELPVPQNPRSPNGALPPPTRMKSYRRGSNGSLGVGSDSESSKPVPTIIEPPRKQLPPPVEKGIRFKRRRNQLLDNDDDEE